MTTTKSAIGTQATAPSISQLSIIAFVLPQFHPIPENDEWWGPGFTEWRNVAKARPLFWRHHQPHLPGELGFYDLRLRNTRERQAELARAAGISAFCYYHYWYAGKLLLQHPIEAVLEEGTPDLPFCLCWANHSWTAHWAGESDRVLIEQTYPGEEDEEAHYRYLRAFFLDKRYFRIRGRPVLMIFHPEAIPDGSAMLRRWNKWANDDGLPGLHMIAMHSDPRLLNAGYTAMAPHAWNDSLARYLTRARAAVQWTRHMLLRYPRWVIPYEALAEEALREAYNGCSRIPTVWPGFDNTPRVGRRGIVLKGATPEAFGRFLSRTIGQLCASEETEDQIVLIKSWNEWAEGNYVEPDVRYQRGWLSALADAKRSAIAASAAPSRLPEQARHAND